MITPLQPIPPPALSSDELDALRMLPDEPRIVPTCFTPNAVCARLISLKLAAYDYVAGGRSAISRTQRGREALRMVN